MSKSLYSKSQRPLIPARRRLKSASQIRNPVRLMFSLSTLAAVSGFLLATSLQHSQPTVHLESSNSVVLVDETFYIDFFVETNQPVNTVTARINYPENLARITQLRDGESILSLWPSPPEDTGGLITFSGGAYRQGFTGTHRVLRIAAQAKRAGVIRFTPEDVVLLRGDGSGSELSIRLNADSAVEVIAVSNELDRAQEMTDRSNTSTHMSSISTDLNNSGSVTLQDISIFMAAWHNGSPIYDFTGDGQMTLRDFSILLADYFRDRGQ